MFDRIHKLVRLRQRILAVVTVCVMALALLLAHSAFTSGHHKDDAHHSGGATVVLAVCLAVLQAGVAVAVAQFVRRPRERMSSWRLPVLTLTPAPVIGGPDPPGPSTPQLQVFLR
jgi:hypothetical protein